MTSDCSEDKTKPNKTEFAFFLTKRKNNGENKEKAFVKTNLKARNLIHVVSSPRTAWQNSTVQRMNSKGESCKCPGVNQKDDKETNQLFWDKSYLNYV